MTPERMRAYIAALEESNKDLAQVINDVTEANIKLRRKCMRLKTENEEYAQHIEALDPEYFRTDEMTIAKTIEERE